MIEVAQIFLTLIYSGSYLIEYLILKSKSLQLSIEEVIRYRRNIGYDRW